MKNCLILNRTKNGKPTLVSDLYRMLITWEEEAIIMQLLLQEL